MGNWTKIEEGNVTIINHSTSSVIEVVINGDDFGALSKQLWLDYYDFDALKKAIQKTDQL